MTPAVMIAVDAFALSPKYRGNRAAAIEDLVIAGLGVNGINIDEAA